MNPIIAASVLVPLMIMLATFLVDRLEKSTTEQTKQIEPGNNNDKEKNDPPNDLVDLSGGMYGI